MVATWVSRIPAIKSALHLNDATFGLALLGSALGSGLAIPVCGWLVGRFGTRRTVLGTSLGFCLALIPIPFASSASKLAAALFLLGAMAGSMDVSMNVQGVETERNLGHPIMSRLHGFYSAGGMLGGAFGGFAASRGIIPGIYFVMAAIVLGTTAVLLAWNAPEREHVEERHRPASRIPRQLLVIGAIAFFVLLSEGAMADWTGVYLSQILNAGPGAAAMGFTAFSAAMALFRLLGDMITHRLGGRRVVVAGCLIAASGVGIAIAAPSIVWAIAGFSLAGVGLSVIVPLAFGAGGRIPGLAPGAGIATVTWLGYTGFLVGPPLIGFTSNATSLRFGLSLVVCSCLASAALAKRWLKR